MLALAGGSDFALFFQQTSELILGSFRRRDWEKAVSWTAEWLCLLCDNFDLSPFAPVLLEALTVVMAEPAVPIQAKGFVAMRD